MQELPISNNPPNKQLSGIFLRVAQLWDWLTRPHVDIRNLEVRRQSRLLASLLVFLIALGGVAALYQLLTIPNAALTLRSMIIGLLVLAVGFYINRIGYYHTAALITATIPSLATFSSLIFDPIDRMALGFLLVGVLFSSLLLTRRLTALLAIINIVGLILLPTLNPIWTYQRITSPLIFNIILPVLLLVFMHHRDLVAQDSQLELSESEAKYRTLFINSSDAIFVVNAQGYITDLNKAGQQLLGYTGAELGTLKLTDLYSSEEEGKRLEAAWRSGRLQDVETQIRKQNGKLIDCTVTVSQSPALFRDAVCIQGIVRDISAQKRAEAQRLELALINERMELLREFVSNLSHDFKTPLTIINTNLYLLSKLDDPVTRDHQLEQIKTQTLHLEKLIQDILIVSRLDSTPQIVDEPVDLALLIYDVETSLRNPAAQKSIELTVSLEPGTPELQGNAEDLYRAVVNLVDNAIHYTPAGGKVTVEVRREQHHIIIEVQDTGIGINPEELPRIFDRFYRAENARTIIRSGSGLGLAIVKRIVEMHGGYVSVDSTPGKGTNFRLILPLDKNVVH